MFVLKQRLKNKYLFMSLSVCDKISAYYPILKTVFESLVEFSTDFEFVVIVMKSLSLSQKV